METESGLVAAQGWGQRETGVMVVARGHGVSFGGDENVLELYSGDSCIIL